MTYYCSLLLTFCFLFCLLDCSCSCSCCCSASSPRHVALDLEVRDGDDETALGLATALHHYQLAAMLLSAAGRIEATTSSGLTILHKAILRDDAGAASFLLEHGANINTRYVEEIWSCSAKCCWFSDVLCQLFVIISLFMKPYLSACLAVSVGLSFSLCLSLFLFFLFPSAVFFLYYGFAT